MRKRPSITVQNEGYLFIAPYFIFIVLFVLLPVIANLYLSFTRYDLRSISFVGLRNYRSLVSDRLFLISVRNTFIYTVFALPGAMVAGLGTALLLKRQMPGLAVFRTVVYLPHVISMVAVSMMWLWLYEPAFGVINRALDLFGLPGKNWLFDPDTALGSIIVMSVWKAVGYNMVVYLAGIHAIPAYLYEAAIIDGANAPQQLRYITIPMLAPITFFLFVTGLINSFKVFEQVNILTRGGPLNTTTTIAHQIYIRGVTELRMGYSAAIAIALLVVIGGITVLNFRYGKQGKDIDV